MESVGAADGAPTNSASNVAAAADTIAGTIAAAANETAPRAPRPVLISI